MGRTGSRIPPVGISWEEIKSKLESEGSKNKAYDSDVDGVFDLAAIPTIPRSKLEYPTEDVTFAYLAAINKIKHFPHSDTWSGGHEVLTYDSFADKAVEVALRDGAGAIGRGDGVDDEYEAWLESEASTADFALTKIVNGVLTVLASEAVDIGANSTHLVKISISGSTIKGYRNDMVTEKISATDTDLASGYFGYKFHSDSRPLSGFDAILQAPSSPVNPAKAIVEVEVIGNGTEDDPFKPNLAKLLDKHPEFGDIDKLVVTWGAFDPKPEHNTMLITITSGNPYTGEKAITEQIEHAKSKNLKVLKPPSDYSEAIEQYRQLKKDFPEWIAGSENYCYQTLGHPDIEPLAVADFYYGELIEHKTHYKQLKRVPEWEMEKTLNMWNERIKRVTAVPAERKEKHQKKLEEVLKLGW